MGHARERIAWALLVLLLAGFGWPNRAQRLMAELRGDADVERRVDLVRLLATMAGDEVREALLEACSDRQPGVRAAALQAIARSTEPPLDVMRQLLADPAPAVRASAAEALAAAHDGESVDRLIRSLADEEPVVRAASARALGALLNDKATGPLASALSDANSEVAVASAEALCAIAGSDAEAQIAARFPLLAPAAQRALLDALLSAPPALARRPALQALVSEQPAVVRAGLQLVQRHALREALPAVTALCASSDEKVAHAAQLVVATLSAHEQRIEPQPWLPALLDAGNPRLARERVEPTLLALERLVPEGARLAGDPLAEWLVRAPDAAKPRIAALLARTGAAVSAAPLLPLLRHGDGRLRAALCTVFSHTRQTKMADALLPLLLDDEPEVRAAAARAVGDLADTELVLTLADQLEELAPRQRRSTAEALRFASARLSVRLGEDEREQVRDAVVAALNGVDEPTAALLVRSLALVDARAATMLLQREGERVRSTRRIALLRASATDRGPEARALRALYRRERDPALAATALTAQLLARELGSPEELLELLEGQRWPVGPLAALGLSRSNPAALGALRARLCGASERAREPTTRHNLRVALARAGERCATIELASDPLEPSARGAPVETQARATFVVLMLDDQSALVSARDASGDASWPMFQHLSERSAWHLPYRANR